MQYLQALPTLVTVFLLAYMGFLVYRNSHNLTNRLFLTFLLADSLWLMSVFLVTHPALGASNAYVGRSVYGIALALAILIQVFTNSLLKIRHGRVYNSFLFGGGAIVLALTFFTDKIITGIKIIDGFPYPVYGPLYKVFLIFLVVIVGAFLYFMFARWQSLERSRDVGAKRQLDIVATGLTLFTLLTLLTNLILPAIFSSAWTSQFSPIGSLVLAFAFFIAIGRYKLFDVRTAVVRSTTYIFLITILALGFVLTANIFGASLAHFGSYARWQQIFNAILALAIAISYQPLKRAFDRITNRYFFRDVYDTQDVVGRLNNILISNVDMHRLLSLCESLLEDTLKLDFVSIAVFTDKEKLYTVNSQRWVAVRLHGGVRERLLQLPDKIVSLRNLPASEHELRKLFEEKNIGVIGKMISHEDAVGFIAFGNKKSDIPLTAQDLGVLSIAADQIAIAAQNALRFAQIENFNLTLQEKIDDATRKLRRANDKLRRLNETKDDFISMASHQLRTPLTSVKGYVSMVLDGDAGKITRLQRRLLNQSFVSAQRMVYLISDLLNVSRLKTGKFIIEPARCNLAKVIEEEVAQLQETAKGRHLELVYHKPEHFPVLMLDETKLRQVIMNFLDNAVYYTPAGKHIEVHLVDKLQSIEFTVIDEGIGVPRHEQHHLFTKFFRAPNAKRARPDGTGLGLFMAKKVIIAQGGAVIFKSQEGRGSTFGFTFAKAHLIPPGAGTPDPQEQGMPPIDAPPAN